MRFGILGAGAMGSVFGGRLALAGHDVTLVDTWREHVEAVQRDGLTLSSSQGELHADLNAVVDPSGLDPFETVIVLTKGHAVAAAAAGLRPAADEDTWIAPLMNGLGHDRTLASVFSADRVVPGTTLVGAEIVAPGHTKMSEYTAAGKGTSHLGRPRTATRMPDEVVEIARILSDARLPTVALDDVDAVIWRKLSIAASTGPLGAVLRRTIGEVWDDPESRANLRALFDEILAVAAAEGVALDAAELWAEDFETVLPASGFTYSSMTVDVMKGRPTEIGSFSVEVARRGAEHGVATPVSEAIGRMVRALESTPARIDGDALVRHPEIWKGADA
jgi:2-dehydropantoate 2-reductase